MHATAAKNASIIERFDTTTSTSRNPVSSAVGCYHTARLAGRPTAQSPFEKQSGSASDCFVTVLISAWKVESMKDGATFGTELLAIK
jgi:hypothetical protein